MSNGFALHPRLAATGQALGVRGDCLVLLKGDARWPWLIVVPQRPGLEHFDQLTAEDLSTIAAAGAALRQLPGVERVNVGQLGNEVPQLHVHVVGRFPGDPSWPGPVWGVEGKVAYADVARAGLSHALAQYLSLTH